MLLYLSSQCRSFIAVCFLVTDVGAAYGSNGLVGKWSANFPTPGEKAATVFIEFRADGTMRQATHILGHTVEGDYSYIVKDGHVTETLKRSLFDGKPLKLTVLKRPAAVYTYRIDGNRLTLRPISPGTALILTKTK